MPERLHMIPISITSPNNELLKNIRKLHSRSGREKLGLFLLEGETLLSEAASKQLAVQAVVISEGVWKAGVSSLFQDSIARLPASCKLYLVADEEFRQLSTTSTPTTVIAVAKQLSYQADDLFKSKPPLVIIADSIQDPGNLGTIFRTALASGVSGIILSKGTVDHFNPKVVRSAMGALFTVPFISNISNNQILDLCKHYDISLHALDAQGTIPYWQADLINPCAIILGNEGQGLSPELLEQSDSIIAIPMKPESESLNVAISGAVILFESFKQRYCQRDQ